MRDRFALLAVPSDWEVAMLLSTEQVAVELRLKERGTVAKVGNDATATFDFELQIVPSSLRIAPIFGVCRDWTSLQNVAMCPTMKEQLADFSQS